MPGRDEESQTNGHVCSLLSPLEQTHHRKSHTEVTLRAYYVMLWIMYKNLETSITAPESSSTCTWIYMQMMLIAPYQRD